MGLASVGAHKLGGILAVGKIFNASVKIGRSRARRNSGIKPGQPLPILPMKTEGCAPAEQERT
jgi:hypothetical protein